MKLLFLILSLILPQAAMAQQADADPYAECMAVLAAPPFVDILTKNEGNDFYKINDPENVQALVGLTCRVDELTTFFEDAGWKFLRYTGNSSLIGPFGIPGAKYYSDGSAHYCLKRRIFYGILGLKCRPYARIDFYEGRISNLGSYTSK